MFTEQSIFLTFICLDFHFSSFQNDVSCLRATRALMSYLPLSNDPSTHNHLPPTDPPDRTCPALEHLVPDDPNVPYDMLSVIKQIVDHSTVFEIMPSFAPNITTCFARMEGRTVGVVGNNPAHSAGCLDIDSSTKAAR